MILKSFERLKFGVIFLLILVTGVTLHAGRSPVYFNVLDYGAKADGITKNTEAIKRAIDTAAEAGGGTVYFPSGEYLTGPIHLRSHITIFVDAGATLKFSRDFDDYLPMITSRWEGTVGMNFSPFIYGYQVEDIAIRGQGTLDGQGEAWWQFLRNLKEEQNRFGEVRTQTKWQKMHQELNQKTIKPDNWNWNASHFLRPPFIHPFDCKNILIEGVTIKNSPFWTINPALCENVTVTGVTILNPPDSYNTDGINPTSCRNVRISDCLISVGDDCITLKSGRDEDGRRIGKPTENVTITNCTMMSGHGGVVIGSEMSGDVRKIAISNCVFDGTDRGIRIKSMRGRGGIVEEIRVSNIVMKNIQREAIVLNMFYQETPDEPVSDRTPCFRNIHISNLTASRVRRAGQLLGLEEMPIDNVTLNDINIDAEEGFSIQNAKNIELHDITVNTKKGAALTAENIQNLEVDGFKTLSPRDAVPVFALKNVENAFIHDTNPVPGTTQYLEVTGAQSRDIRLSGNNFYHVKTPVVLDSSVQADAVNQE